MFLLHLLVSFHYNAHFIYFSAYEFNPWCIHSSLTSPNSFESKPCHCLGLCPSLMHWYAPSNPGVSKWNLWCGVFTWSIRHRGGIELLANQPGILLANKNHTMANCLAIKKRRVFRSVKMSHWKLSDETFWSGMLIAQHPSAQRYTLELSPLASLQP